jgi:hypothetical protein
MNKKTSANVYLLIFIVSNSIEGRIPAELTCGIHNCRLIVVLYARLMVLGLRGHRGYFRGVET